MADNDHAGSSADEHRQHQREPVTLVVEYEGADDLVADYTENLSSGGTFVNTAHEFEIGTEVQLVLSFPGLLEPIRLAGVVRWTRSGDSEIRGVGLEFTNLDGDVSQQLEKVVGLIESRDPAVVSRLCRVLVVEDNPHVAKLIRDGLRGSGKRAFGDDLAFNFRTASNGRDALDLLLTEQFDAIIIDVYMPILDGPSVIEEVRANPSLAKLPIIAVSAGGDRARMFAMAAGADFFLHKPMRLRQIIDTMQQLLHLRKDE
ncbi:MAG TPA: TIGR02266 family protein [Kofleriaceae bacterium]|nr:TIGR02266 family protein [Kofleriaceae bacterium]